MYVGDLVGSMESTARRLSSTGEEPIARMRYEVIADNNANRLVLLTLTIITLIMYGLIAGGIPNGATS